MVGTYPSAENSGAHRPQEYVPGALLVNNRIGQGSLTEGEGSVQLTSISLLVQMSSFLF
jgi:hypothetical protein